MTQVQAKEKNSLFFFLQNLFPVWKNCCLCGNSGNFADLIEEKAGVDYCRIYLLTGGFALLKTLLGIMLNI